MRNASAILVLFFVLMFQPGRVYSQELNGGWYSGAYISNEDTIKLSVAFSMISENSDLHQVYLLYYVDSGYYEEQFYVSQEGRALYFSADSMNFPAKAQGSFSQRKFVITDPSILKYLAAAKSVTLPKAETGTMEDGPSDEDRPFGDDGVDPPGVGDFELISDEMEYIYSDEHTADSNEAIYFCEDEPSFPGGKDSLYAFIDQNKVYPPGLGTICAEGVVYIQFIVERDGSLTNPVIMKSPDQLLSEEAIRLIGIMPKWDPGAQSEVLVRVRYTIPISFRIKR